MLEFNNIDEIKRFYNKESNTYIFKEGDTYLNIKFNFNLNINSNIDARNIDAMDIKAWNIDAMDIKARNIDAEDIIAGAIKARNITYYALCIAYSILDCNSIIGKRTNHIEYCLDNSVIIRGDIKKDD